MTSQTIAIDSIDCDRRFWFAVISALGEDPSRARPGHNKALIDQYVRALRGGAVFPPITLVRAGDGKLFLYDGHHRLEASKAVGRATIGATVWQERDFMGALPLLALSLTQDNARPFCSDILNDD